MKHGMDESTLDTSLQPRATSIAPTLILSCSASARRPTRPVLFYVSENMNRWHRCNGGTITKFFEHSVAFWHAPTKPIDNPLQLPEEFAYYALLSKCSWDTRNHPIPEPFARIGHGPRNAILGPRFHALTNTRIIPWPCRWYFACKDVTGHAVASEDLFWLI
ncbi:hypothetical protein BC826DRAFT_598010 [Russula brevipes]|nr:hypothetical protein BC826DRAFT_598010 [Russula brevipes]